MDGCHHLNFDQDVLPMVACLAHTMPLITVTDAGIDVNHFPKRHYLYLTPPDAKLIARHGAIKIFVEVTNLCYLC